MEERRKLPLRYESHLRKLKDSVKRISLVIMSVGAVTEVVIEVLVIVVVVLVMAVVVVAIVMLIVVYDGLWL